MVCEPLSNHVVMAHLHQLFEGRLAGLARPPNQPLQDLRPTACSATEPLVPASAWLQQGGSDRGDTRDLRTGTMISELERVRIYHRGRCGRLPQGALATIARWRKITWSRIQPLGRSIRAINCFRDRRCDDLSKVKASKLAHTQVDRGSLQLGEDRRGVRPNQIALRRARRH